MTIAVNTRFLSNKYPEGYGYFLKEIFTRITKDHPEHQFVFLFDRAYDPQFLFEKNVVPVIAGPPARHPLLWKWWYDVKIPFVLKKYKADVFVSCDGFCSLTTKVPQCLVVHDLAFLHYPAFSKKLHAVYLKKYTSRFLKKASSIATVSAFSKQDILAHYHNIPADKISIVYNGVREGFHPLDEKIRVATREKYTSGRNYFIYAGAIHPRKNLVTLLKAFSVFKKRQQSNWKLVLAGRLAWKNNSFLEKLKSYKYREDVIVTGYVEEQELVRLTGAAYAMVYPSLWEGFGVPPLEALRSGVPVITSAGSAMQEICGDAALYADATDHQDLADKMMLLYKDEVLRKQLVEKGITVTRQYSWQRSATLLWQSIEKALD